MQNWETTTFGIMAAVGPIIQTSDIAPPWLKLVGQILATIGLAGLGITAASSRGVQRQIDSQPDTTTLTIKETKSTVQQDEKPSNP